MENYINLSIDFNHYDVFSFILIFIGLLSLGLIFGFKLMYLLKNSKNKMDDKVLNIFTKSSGSAIVSITLVFILFKLPIIGVLYFAILLGMALYLFLGFITTDNPPPPNGNPENNDFNEIYNKGNDKRNQQGQSGKSFGDTFLKKSSENYIKNKIKFIKKENRKNIKLYMNRNVVRALLNILPHVNKDSIEHKLVLFNKTDCNMEIKNFNKLKRKKIYFSFIKYDY